MPVAWRAAFCLACAVGGMLAGHLIQMCLKDFDKEKDVGSLYLALMNAGIMGMLMFEMIRVVLAP